MTACVGTKPCPGDLRRGCLATILDSKERCAFCTRTVALRPVVTRARHRQSDDAWSWSELVRQSGGDEEAALYLLADQVGNGSYQDKGVA